MAIDKQSTGDLTLDDGDAENVLGGQKKRKHPKPHPKPKTYPVTYIKVPAPSNVQTVAGPADEDCTDDPYASDPPVN
jgi:hypothetical protein